MENAEVRLISHGIESLAEWFAQCGKSVASAIYQGMHGTLGHYGIAHVDNGPVNLIGAFTNTRPSHMRRWLSRKLSSRHNNPSQQTEVSELPLQQCLDALLAAQRPPSNSFPRIKPNIIPSLATRLIKSASTYDQNMASVDRYPPIYSPKDNLHPLTILTLVVAIVPHVDAAPAPSTLERPIQNHWLGTIFFVCWWIGVSMLVCDDTKCAIKASEPQIQRKISDVG